MKYVPKNQNQQQQEENQQNDYQKKEQSFYQQKYQKKNYEYPQDNQQKSRDRGRGRGRGYYQEYEEEQYFEKRKKEKREYEQWDFFDKKNQQMISQQDDITHSRKLEQNKNKGINMKNLGTAKNYLIDDQGQNENLKQEKIQFIQEEDKEKINMKDKAKIKYNYMDFLNQYENLTEQCIDLVESLAKGSQECLICHNPIYQRSAIWNCKQCHQPFHLGCIKRWINKLNNQIDEQEEEKQIPNDNNESDENESRQQAKQLTAFFTWTCPSCNYNYAENQLPVYICYCGKFQEPQYSAMVLPHSCNEYCEKKKNEICSHNRCELLCHPGSCPPCTFKVQVWCYCGKESNRVPCQVQLRSDFSCEQQCGKLLNCKIHKCLEMCHKGQCQPCQQSIQQYCYCKKQSNEMLCGQKQFYCGQICQKQLDCGKHKCQKICHEGQCQSCQLNPQKMLYCPCGRVKIQDLLGKQRHNCTDPIPVCGASHCDKFLQCGMHQCKRQCHTNECQLCEELVIQYCQCGKQKRQIPCYKLNYKFYQPYMSETERDEILNFRCKKICNQMKTCNKHKCQELCCTAKRGMSDVEGKHLCLQVCNKTLSCGKHQCNQFCHLGKCQYCRFVSNQPLYCPCNTIKIDPPIHCSQQQPTCDNQCQKILNCGHRCSIKCHLGNCPPCLEIMTKMCNCGREIMANVYCSESKHSCGRECELDLPCEHKCQKICHLPGQCYGSQQELLEYGCIQTCNKQRKNCIHRCQQKCHPQMPCPDVPCNAEIRMYCKCKTRFIMVLCNQTNESHEEQKEQFIECKTECLKKQRNQRLAEAFGDKTKDANQIINEYYPEDALEFARDNKKFVLKVEKMLTEVVYDKKVRSFPNLHSLKRQFVQMYVHEHFHLEMCTYGNKGQKKVTDVFWKENCKVPDIMVSELINLIEKGIISANSEDTRNMLFEASLHIYNVPKGTTINDLKNFLNSFKNEMYTEKGKEKDEYYLHFYQKIRCKDAYTYITNSPNQFTCIDMIFHKKEIGTNSESIAQVDTNTNKQTRKKEHKVDNEGFTIIN